MKEKPLAFDAPESPRFINVSSTLVQNEHGGYLRCDDDDPTILWCAEGKPWHAVTDGYSIWFATAVSTEGS